jgi:hypothetical protein
MGQVIADFQLQIFDSSIARANRQSNRQSAQ